MLYMHTIHRRHPPLLSKSPAIYYPNPSITFKMEQQHASRCRRLRITRVHLKLNVTSPLVSHTTELNNKDAPQAVWRRWLARTISLRPIKNIIPEVTLSLSPIKNIIYEVMRGEGLCRA